METLSGSIERIRYHSEENGFCVFFVKAEGHKGEVTATGHAACLNVGETVTLAGDWIIDRRYGRQFKAESLSVDPPSNVEGILRYLSSGLIKGIGPTLAKNMVTYFGETLFDVIEHDPEQLLKIRNIGKSRLEKILASFSSQKAIRKIMVFLHSHGVSKAHAVRIYKTYGAEAVAKVQEDPYRLAHDIRGIGFLSADKIAQALGWKLDSPERVRAGVSHALWQATNEGHCGLLRTKLILNTCDLLGVSSTLVEAGIDKEVAERRLILDGTAGHAVVYLPLLYRTEQSVADHLGRLMEAPSQGELLDAAMMYERIKPTLKKPLSSDKEAALKSLGQFRVMVITGGPGTGKTTMLNVVLKLYDQVGARIMLAAPTGRAAQRMAEATGRESATLHRLLGFRPGGQPTFNENNPLSCDLLCLDETSMDDIFLMNATLRAVPTGATVILVGDEDQLPSVGPGNVLGDIIASGVIPTARLTQVFRQEEGSFIIDGAHAINHGQMPTFATKTNPGDFYFIEREAASEAANQIIDLVKNRLPAKGGFDPVRDIQVVCPMFKGDCGVLMMNQALQKALNPNAKEGEGIVRYATHYYVGDKVMQTANDYDLGVFNGDIGYIASITPEEVQIDFNGRLVTMDPDDLDQVTLAYAATVHKLQGSQAPAIVMPVTTQHFKMLERKLLYTGVTRGEKMVVLVGQKKALEIAVRNVNTVRRQTRLKEALQARFNALEDI